MPIDNFCVLPHVLIVYYHTENCHCFSAKIIANLPLAFCADFLYNYLSYASLF